MGHVSLDEVLWEREKGRTSLYSVREHVSRSKVRKGREKGVVVDVSPVCFMQHVFESYVWGCHSSGNEPRGSWLWNFAAKSRRSAGGSVSKTNGTRVVLAGVIRVVCPLSSTGFCGFGVSCPSLPLSLWFRFLTTQECQRLENQLMELRLELEYQEADSQQLAREVSKRNEIIQASSELVRQLVSSSGCIGILFLLSWSFHTASVKDLLHGIEELSSRKKERVSSCVCGSCGDSCDPKFGWGLRSSARKKQKCAQRMRHCFATSTKETRISLD